MSNIKFSTDYNLVDVVLYSATGKISLKPQLVELNLFEDLFAGTLTGQLVMSDGVGIINGASLNGTEYIKITLDKPSTEGVEFSRTFRIFSITNRSFSKNNTFENYTINFCSDEFLLSEQYRICKSYKQQKISDIVTDILTNFLGVGNSDTKVISVEDTTFTYDFILPNKKIFETINWLSTYATPSQSGYSGTGNNMNGADMIFFENNDGIFFASLGTLFKQTPVFKYTFAPKNVVPGDINQEYYNILNFEVLESFDTLKALMNGTFANRLITIDPVLRKKYVTDFSYDVLAQQYDTMNPAPVTNNYKNRFGQAMYESPELNLNGTEAGVLRMAPSNYNQINQSSYLKQLPDTVAPDINAENYIPNRVGQLALSQYQRVRITVPGNPEIFVGMTIDLDVAGVGITTKDKQRTSDNQLSGTYLVSAVRHVLNNTTYISVVELCKGSNAQPLAGVNDYDPTWVELVTGSQTVSS